MFLKEVKEILESINKPLYHASPYDNIKELDSEYDSSGDREERGKLIYTTDNKQFAIGMGFTWSTNEGFDFDEINGNWQLSMPKKEKYRLTVPLYLYTIDSHGFNKINSKYPEYGKIGTAKVLHKKKYNTVLDALRNSGIKLILK